MKKLCLSVLAVVIAFATCFAQKTRINYDDHWAKMTEVEKMINAPVFKDAVYNILDFGAKEGVEDYSNKAINLAIEKCHADGGGIVLVPAGIFYTGPITLLSNVNLHVSEGATLRFSINPEDYLPQVRSVWEGWDCYNLRPLIYAFEQENIGITGGGTLDGQASDENWWIWKGRTEHGWLPGMISQEWNGTAENGGRNRLSRMEEERVPVEQRIMTIEDRLRPAFIEPFSCKNVLIEGLTLIRAPFWLLHPTKCENVTVRGMKLTSRGPNNDGCDPESSKYVLIENCLFDTGDDCIAIKSGKNDDGRQRGMPSEYFIIRNNKMQAGHGGVVLGSEISGDVRNVWVENCIMDSPDLERVIRVKSNPIRGGVLENFFIRNIEVGQSALAVFYAELKYEKVTEGPNMPVIRNMILENINSGRSRYAVFIDGFDPATTGIPAQVTNIVFRNCNFDGIRSPRVNRITGAENIIFDNVRINGELFELDLNNN